MRITQSVYQSLLGNDLLYSLSEDDLTHECFTLRHEKEFVVMFGKMKGETIKATCVYVSFYEFSDKEVWVYMQYEVDTTLD